MDIKPIETFYNGYRFRSRLEARWAVFFDAMGIKYEYEPEGFEFDDGTKYLPDFYLPDADAYIEIKSIGSFSIEKVDDGVQGINGREEVYKYMKAASEISKEHTFIIFMGDPYDAIVNRETRKGKSHLFYMGECFYKKASKNDPDIKPCNRDIKCAECDTPFYPCYSYAVNGFTTKAVIFIGDDKTSFIPKAYGNFEILLFGDNPYFSLELQDLEKYLVMNIKAAKKARQARFEHGNFEEVNRCLKTDI